MDPKKRQQKELIEDESGIAAVQNQLLESYQSGVAEDQLHPNKGIHHFNNMKK
ncbi:hypothetical protein [Ornithinibacillus gellani]|uniref:hypothetical protein n=1 Tax=Ornithinibacillus gellani TaxID=2293253 RepID=UPI001680BD82|nr:hypothetical protein [Ornithinibacillus gellani]